MGYVSDLESFPTTLPQPTRLCSRFLGTKRSSHSQIPSPHLISHTGFSPSCEQLLRGHNHNQILFVHLGSPSANQRQLLSTLKMATADSSVTPAQAAQVLAQNPLNSNIKTLLFSQTLSDFTIICNGTRISAHRIVLYTQSSFFKGALSNNMKVSASLDSTISAVANLNRRNWTASLS